MQSFKILYEENNESYLELNSKHDLYQKAVRELSSDFNQSIIKLTQYSKNLMKQTEAPNVLVISKQIGGFAKKGIKINNKFYDDLWYVDIDRESVINEDLSIFAHESAHVMMETTIPNYPEGKSTFHHLSMSSSDYFLAFYEGWAEQFERFCYENDLKYKKKKDEIYENFDTPLMLWQSNIDTMLRVHETPKNKFIYKKLPINHDINLDIKDQIILEHTFPSFNHLKLKSIEEMLSCEGLIGTIFYYINKNERLQNRYLNNEFYEEFMILNEVDVKQIVTPFQNVILKNLYVFKHIKMDIHKGKNPTIAFVEKWCELFEDDREDVLRIFLSLTVGKSVNDTLSKCYESLAYYAMIGNMEETKNHLMKYREEFNDILDQVVNQKITFNEIKEEIWLENPNITIPRVLWDATSQVPLRVNLNTATPLQLSTFNRVDIETAKKIVSLREKKNGFQHINEVEELIPYVLDEEI